MSSKFQKLIAKCESLEAKNEGFKDILEKIKLFKKKITGEVVELTTQKSVITDEDKIRKTQFQYKGANVADLIEENFSVVVSEIKDFLVGLNKEELESVGKYGYDGVNQFEVDDNSYSPSLIYFDKASSEFLFFSVATGLQYSLPRGTDEEDIDVTDPDEFVLERLPSADTVILAKAELFPNGDIGQVKCSVLPGNAKNFDSIVKKETAGNQEISF
ncbi:TPA: hypothetical protein SFZ51_000446 [Campylobacter jejuni]|uniref:Uncharacterized protein n=1 Tax=Campylobacter jejuni TaxID=197 RepID=A0A431EE80_CAMJU|nr:hypothetical protein [Campylobacter jejuni]RTJ79568.1 hypothetical protein C3H57_04155 [Campylobacter jejuni]HEG8090884.1 hypothetical protein [Campylobacter jejuni]HEG8097797.1 hypothetical protein [Campylobacter jejuni]HEG8104602.1 hypothetical protein [Campylobacter jejuni]HEG8133642.1 hypothetical protein [Campylobacter jejuni]